MDHVIPKKYKRSSNEEWNLLPVCDFCNLMKKGTGPQKMRRVLMFGKYCLAEVKTGSRLGMLIHNMVGDRAKRQKGEQFRLWKLTPHKKKTKTRPS